MEGFNIFNNQLKKYEGNESHVVIPEGITSIDDYAFYNCQSIKSITIGDSVLELGDNIFYDCENLEEVIIPDSVYYMGDGVFSRCKNLKYVKLSDKVTSLNKIVFFECANLKEVVLPKNLISIGRSCFEKCHSLKEVKLPDSVRIIDDNAFDDCISLSSINTPTSLTKLGNNVFFNCPNLRLFTIIDTITSIGNGAFETRGAFSLISNSDIEIESRMLDNNWNMNWNIGWNKRFNGNNENNYQLYYSYLPNIDISKWKPNALIILVINYLETFKMHNDISKDLYHRLLDSIKDDCIKIMIKESRYTALNHALENGLISGRDISPYFDRINDQEQKAKLMEYNKEDNNSVIDDLMDLL